MELLEGVAWGAVASAFALGLRHGFDWDHIAAISDITSSQDDRRRAFRFSTLYILGHACVVTALGLVAVLAGSRIPPAVDAVMGRVVGVTLVALGAYVLASLIRHGRDARLRSRWMLALAALSRARTWLRRLHRRGAGVEARETLEFEHDHEPSVLEPHESKVPVGVPVGPAPDDGGGGRHRHPHVHRGAVPEDPFASYGPGTSFGVGVLHGIGAETPTQMLLFVSAAGVAGALGGIVLVLAFVAGLAISNTAVAVAARAGVTSARGSFPVFAGVTVVVGVLSLYLGVALLMGRGTGLPGLG